MLKYLFILAIAVLSGCATTPPVSKLEPSCSKSVQATNSEDKRSLAVARQETTRRYQKEEQERKREEERRQREKMQKEAALKKQAEKNKLTAN